MPLSGREKATIFLSILGAETSARILRYLPEELADLIAAGINHLPTPSTSSLSEVLNEFRSYLALPEGRAEMPQIEPPTRAPAVKAKKNYSFLIYERPQMIAHLLTLMPDDQREEVLTGLPKEKVLVEELYSNLRKTALSEKIGSRLKTHFGAKIFN
jgi:flagellar motor switch protein FliG